MALYTVTVVARTPQALTADPTLVELGPVVDASGLTLTEQLSQEGEFTFSCDPTKLQSDIQTRFRDLYANPCEVRLYRDGTLIFAGPVIGYTATGGRLNVVAKGLLYYTKYMDIGSDVAITYTTTDVFTIARDMVDRFQTANFNYSTSGYGNYGLDVSATSTSGTTLTLVLPRYEGHVVYDLLQYLAQDIGVLELDVDPSTRELLLYTSKGSDVSATVSLDARSMAEYNVFVSVAAGDIANQVNAAYTATNLAELSSDWNANTTFGYVVRTLTGYSNSTEALSAATLTLAVHDKQLVRPGGGFLPVADASYDDFVVGDTIEFAYDFGLGLFQGDFRVVTKRLSVDDLGREQLAVEFE